MSMLRKRPDRVRDDDDDIIKGIRRERIEREISDIEKRAERAESYERTRKQKRKFDVRLYVVMFAVLFSITLAVGIIGYRLLFVVDNIVVECDGELDEGEICEASGIKPGILLYSFSSSRAQEKLIAEMPSVHSLSVHRVMPSTVILTVNVEEPMYYTGIFGKTYFISPELRVIGEMPEGYDTTGLVKLKLPGVRKVTLGEIPVFRDKLADKQFESVTRILSESSLDGEINMIDMHDLFRLRMSCKNMYMIEFGDYSSIDAKLLVASAVLETELFEGKNKAKIDVSDLRKTSVIIDNQISLD